MFDTSKPLAEGLEAAPDGLSLERCPYPDGSADRALWMEAWTVGSDDQDGRPEGIERDRPKTCGGARHIRYI